MFACQEEIYFCTWGSVCKKVSDNDDAFAALFQGVEKNWHCALVNHL